MTNGSVTTARYGKATIALHWVMVLLLAAVFATIEMRVLFERGSDHNRPSLVSGGFRESQEISMNGHVATVVRDPYTDLKKLHAFA